MKFNAKLFVVWFVTQSSIFAAYTPRGFMQASAHEDGPDMRWFGRQGGCADAEALEAQGNEHFQKNQLYQQQSRQKAARQEQLRSLFRTYGAADLIKRQLDEWHMLFVNLKDLLDDDFAFFQMRFIQALITDIKHPDVALILLMLARAGIDFSCVDSAGKTLYQLAVAHNNQSAICFFRNNMQLLSEQDRLAVSFEGLAVA